MTNNKLIKLGCFVNMTAPNYLLGSLYEALKQNANCFMFYTGSPQSKIRINLEKLKIKEFQLALTKNNIQINDIFVHAPYIINLANDNQEKRLSFIQFLQNEVQRTIAIGCQYLIIHPGNNPHWKQGVEYIASALNTIIANNEKIIICLETMAGKGNEIGWNFQQLKAIINLIKNKKQIGICLDTCHLNDAGYDVSDPDKILNELIKIIGFNYLKVIHLNNSLNQQGSRKDRHANIENGTISISSLKSWVWHPKLINICKILETPWINQQPVYDKEIKLLLDNKNN